MELKKVSDYIVEFLINNNVKSVFGYPGGMVTHLMDSFDKYKNNINNYLCYHEQAAAFAACSNAQLTNNIGIAYATSGPGATNLITGIGQAYFDSIPVLFITGQVNMYESKKDLKVRQKGFQETDIVSIVQPITKYSVMIENPDDIKYQLQKAIYMAKEGRPGPVLLDIPMNIFRSEVEADNLKGFIKEEKEIKYNLELFDYINNSKRPVIIAGAGINIADVRYDFRELVKKFNIPVVSSMLGIDILEKDNPLNFGFIGAYGTRTANFVITNSDLIISFGSRLDTRQTGTNIENFAPNAKIVRIDIDNNELDNKIRKDQVNLNYDLKTYVKYLNDNYKNTNSYDEWIGVCKKYKCNLQYLDKSIPNEYVIKVSELLDDNFVITTDVGQNQVWVAQSFNNKKGHRILFSGGHGSMGYSLPAAIGAYYATNKNVIAFCGDGGLQMNIQELQFLARENIPIKIVVFNNSALGMIRHFQEMYFESNFVQTIEGMGYSTPDFVEISQSYGIKAMNIEKEEELNQIKERLYDKEPLLINLNVGNRTYVYPKLAMDKPIDDQEPLMDRNLYESLKKL